MTAFLLFLFWLLLGLVFVLKTGRWMGRWGKGRSGYERFGFGILFVAVVLWGGSKPSGNAPLRVGVPPPRMEMPSGGCFTANEWRLGVVLAGVSTQGVFSLEKPNGAEVYVPWQQRGAHQDGFWRDIPPFSLGGGVYSNAFISSCGTVALNRPQSSARVKTLPDGSTGVFLAPFHAALGVVPEGNWGRIAFSTNSLFWSETTPWGVTRLTWQHVLLGRLADAPISFQLELRPNGDFVYRLDASTLFAQSHSITNDFVMGLQVQDAATMACFQTNGITGGITSLAPQMTLLWKSIAGLNPEVDDFDGDGLSDSDEITRTHTDPRWGDSDLDGLSDGEEDESGSDPRNPDEDVDGLLDGGGGTPWDPSTWDACATAQFRISGLGETPVVLDVGGQSVYFTSSNDVQTITLAVGETYLVRVFAREPCFVGVAMETLAGVILLEDVQDVLGGGGWIPEQSAVSVGKLITPKIGITPNPLCFHNENDISANLTVRPALSGDWHWVYDGYQSQGWTATVQLPYEDPELTHFPKDFRAIFTTKSGAILQLGESVTNCDRHTWDEEDEEGDDEEDDEYIEEDDFEHEHCWHDAGDHYHCCYDLECLECSQDVLEDGTSSAVYQPRVTADPPTGPPEESEESEEPEQPDESEESQKPENSGFFLNVNHDDDDQSGVWDSQETGSLVDSSDDDLFVHFALGHHSEPCCNCDKHQDYRTNFFYRENVSSNLQLWNDAQKTAAFAGPLSRGDSLCIEGLAPSSRFKGDSIRWSYEETNGTHCEVTNFVTVLSQRFYPDLDFDGDVDAQDRANTPKLSSSFGWAIPAETNILQRLVLHNDMGLSGTHTLALSADAPFVVWQTSTPMPEDEPILVPGQIITNGVDGVNWITGHESHVYVQALTNGTGRIRSLFHGSGDAEGVLCRTTLKVTAVDLDVELWSRDPETETLELVTPLVLASHPVPQVSLEVNRAELDTQGNLQIVLEGTFCDRLSEVVDASDRINSIYLEQNKILVESWEVDYSPSQETTWQQVDSETEFTKVLTISQSDVHSGILLFTLETDPNANGEIGRAFAYVLIGEEALPQTTYYSQHSLSLTFPQAPTRTTQDVVWVSYGTNTLAHEYASPSVPSDWCFTNSMGCVATTQPLTGFSETQIDEFDATIQICLDGMTDEQFLATLRETGTNTCSFQAIQYKSVEFETCPVVLDTGILTGFSEGFMMPFVAKVVSKEVPNEQLDDLFEQWDMAWRFHDEPLALHHDTTGSYLRTVEDTKPTVWIPSIERPWTLPSEAWAQRCMTFTLGRETCTNFLEYATVLSDPSFHVIEEASELEQPPTRAPRLSGRAATNTEWTLEQVDFFFDLLFGEDGAFWKKTFLDYNNSTIRKGSLSFFSSKQYNINKKTSPLGSGEAFEIVLDEDCDNAVQAALQLFHALNEINRSIFFSQYRGHVYETLFHNIGNDPLVIDRYKEFWNAGYSGLCEVIADLEVLLEVGVSIMPGPYGILIDISDVSESIQERKYGHAVVIAALNALGPIADAKKLKSHLIIASGQKANRYSSEITSVLGRATKLRTRPERMDLLRPYIQSGQIDREAVRYLYDSGFLKGGDPYRTLERFIEQGTQDFPGSGVAHVKGSTQRHHDFPHEFEFEFLAAGYDPDTVGRAISKDFHQSGRGLHAKKGWKSHGGAFNYQWKQFFRGKDESRKWKFNPSNPHGSIKAFLDELRRVTSVPNTEIEWPYPMPTGGK